MIEKCVFCDRMQPPECIMKNDWTGETYTISEYATIQKYLKWKRQNRWWRVLFRWIIGVEVKE